MVMYYVCVIGFALMYRRVVLFCVCVCDYALFICHWFCADMYVCVCVCRRVVMFFTSSFTVYVMVI